MTKRFRSKLGPWPTDDHVLPSSSIVHWSRAAQTGRNGMMMVPVTCGSCNRERLIEGPHARGPKSSSFTGLCQSCRKREANHSGGPTHPAWKGGRFKSGGYWYFNLPALSGRSRELAEANPRVGRKGNFIVGEHRLVMALHLDRPLTRHDVVHHRNGNKLDNRIENLELTTHAKHRQLDVKYYKLWQEALAKIAELESELLRCQQTSRS